MFSGIGLDRSAPGKRAGTNTDDICEPDGGSHCIYAASRNGSEQISGEGVFTLDSGMRTADSGGMCGGKILLEVHRTVDLGSVESDGVELSDHLYGQRA